LKATLAASFIHYLFGFSFTHYEHDPSIDFVVIVVVAPCRIMESMDFIDDVVAVVWLDSMFFLQQQYRN
jgi:hypothetical protein